MRKSFIKLVTRTSFLLLSWAVWTIVCVEVQIKSPVILLKEKLKTNEAQSNFIKLVTRTSFLLL